MKPNPIQEEREKSVNRCLPELFSGKYKSVLYVGANQKRQHFLKNFEQSNYKRIVILEAFSENYKFFKNLLESKRPDLYQVLWGKVQEIEKFSLKPFDVIFFWHGPEHLPTEQIEPTLKKLESISNHLVVLGMPFGKYIQGAEYGNPFEEHLSYIYPPFLQKLGYQTETLGKQDVNGSNITAWKYVQNT
jgi:hypothetical protein